MPFIAIQLIILAALAMIHFSACLMVPTMIYDDAP
jgi:hypothetical protein